MNTFLDVIEGRARWSCECADAIAFLDSLPDDSVDLLFTSPPYELARTYGIGEKMVGGQAWVDWMVSVVRAAAPKVKGLIAVNCEGQTRNYAYSGAPFLLFADLHRAGFNLRKPPIFHRVGIPGSGGPDWLRNDYEPIICITRPGRLPWSDNTACGHPPKWAPGGAMSHMLSDGSRVNQWGHSIMSGATVVDEGGVVRSEGKRPSHKLGTGTKGKKNGDTVTVSEGYDPPVLANPGNTIEAKYTADEVLDLLAYLGIADEALPDLLRIKVGGGLMGHPLAHKNEAPFPLGLPEFFVKSFAPPDGVVCDPFDGSGTTCHAAFVNGRRFIGCDIRESQVQLVRRRMATLTPSMFADVA